MAQRPRSRWIITIDGPAAAGKSTAARLLASTLGLRYLDTGAMYRAATWKALRDGVDLSDDAALTATARALRLEMPMSGRVLADGIDVTEAIRGADVTRNVSRVAEVTGVRREMVARQRALASQEGLVAEGRDMATVVFPDADFKFYLDASEGERARRRAREIVEKGGRADLAVVEAEIQRRDRWDSTREVSPLRQGEDTLRIETTHLTPDAVLGAILEELGR